MPKEGEGNFWLKSYTEEHPDITYTNKWVGGFFVVVSYLIALSLTREDKEM